jgi:hypothetical protein
VPRPHHPPPLLARAVSLAAVGLALVACAESSSAKEPFALVSIDDVQKMLGAPDVSIIDANTRQTFEEHHLPGARHYKAAPFAEVLPPDKEQRLVFYCASPS